MNPITSSSLCHAIGPFTLLRDSHLRWQASIHCLPKIFRLLCKAFMQQSTPLPLLSTSRTISQYQHHSIRCPLSCLSTMMIQMSRLLMAVSVPANKVPACSPVPPAAQAYRQWTISPSSLTTIRGLYQLRPWSRKLDSFEQSLKAASRYRSSTAHPQSVLTSCDRDRQTSPSSCTTTTPYPWRGCWSGSNTTTIRSAPTF